MAAADTMLADELAVSANVVEDIRRAQLTEGEHWIREDGNRVVFTPAGRDAVKAILDLPPGPFAKKEEPPPECACEIVRIPPNPVMVEVRVPSRVLVAVRVKTHSGLRPGARLL